MPNRLISANLTIHKKTVRTVDGKLKIKMDDEVTTVHAESMIRLSNIVNSLIGIAIDNGDQIFGWEVTNIQMPEDG